MVVDTKKAKQKNKTKQKKTKQIKIAYRSSSLEMESVNRVQILDGAVCISLRTNAIANGLKLSALLQ